jgi:hypothetical protein
VNDAIDVNDSAKLKKAFASPNFEKKSRIAKKEVPPATLRSVAVINFLRTVDSTIQQINRDAGVGYLPTSFTASYQL